MASKPDRPVRILHVVGGMDRGGVESWLMHVLRHIDHNRLSMDFLVHTDRPCFYDDEIRALGSRIIPCLYPSRPWRYGHSFLRALSDYGPFDVVHSHVHHFSGYVLRLAASVGVPGRIAHSFSAPLAIDEPLWRHLYRLAMRRWIRRYATLGLGNSVKSMQSLFGASWRDDARWQLSYCGIDLARFQDLGDVSVVRSQHSIPREAIVVGHLGRLAPVKNHQFLIRIAEEISKLHSNVWFLLVGEGPLRQQLQELARRRGLTRVIFTGAVTEVESYLRSMDLFVFPSLWEGLPQSMIEAQAAGLGCLCSDAVTREVAIVPGAVRFLPLAAGARAWADACLAMAGQPKIDPQYALERVSDSPFAIHKSVERLQLLYVEAAA